ncbi:hypothetical protein B0H13DRAFT_1900520 [Mycena leptocephala]|nr:hypothetical protein B0H13DRAFT_1900520 [Mycena leptocephala]
MPRMRVATVVDSDTLPRSFDDECEDACMVHSICTCMHAHTHVRVPGVTRMHTAPAAHGEEGDYEDDNEGKEVFAPDPHPYTQPCFSISLEGYASRTTKSTPSVSALSRRGTREKASAGTGARDDGQEEWVKVWDGCMCTHT